MAIITLICTTHNENGNCNSRELLSVLYSLSPEVIFEELSPDNYKQCYDAGKLFTLETSAIKMYLLHHDIIHIPVVKNGLIDNFVQTHTLLHNYESYRQLHNKILSLERLYGFQFLNSDSCDAAFGELKTVEEKILKEEANDAFTNLATSSNAFIDDYENGIIENVYRYCKSNKFGNAVMFIGAAHRKSIILKIKARQKKEKIEIEWDFINE